MEKVYCCSSYGQDSRMDIATNAQTRIQDLDEHQEPKEKCILQKKKIGPTLEGTYHLQSQL